MKTILFAAIVCVFALGASAQMGEPEPSATLTPEQYSQKIRELMAKFNKLKTGAMRYTRIGKANVAKLQEVMNRVDKQRYKCLVLETLRPAPIPLQKMPNVPLKPVNQPLSMEQISARIRNMEASLNKVVTMATRFVSIGKGNIGLMQRFAEASRSAVCGANHYSKCEMGFIYEKNADSCFREAVGRFKTFSEAQTKCHQMGGHLPIIETLAENNAIPSLLQLAVTSPSAADIAHAVWLGVKKIDDEWKLVHPEDSPVSLAGKFNNFYTEAEEADKDCAYLCTNSNSWVKTSCDVNARVLCEKPKNPPPAATATK